MTSSPHLVFIGDVGGPETYHVGDEAMLEANLAAFRRWVPGLTAIVISRDPAWTERQYGVRAVAPFGFPSAAMGTDEERQALLEQLLANVRDDKGEVERGREVIAALATADGLVVSGGGNLSATWPEHVYERAALAQIAQLLGKPVVFLGQTLGPELSLGTRNTLVQALHSAQMVGVRELPSAALALALGVLPERLVYQLDDAFFLKPLPVDEDWAVPLRRGGPPWIAVTLDPFALGQEDTAALDNLASQLARLAETTAARLVFLPHVGVPKAQLPRSDLALGLALANRLAPRHPMRVCDVLGAGEVCWLTGQASLVLSSRYHPLVFGLAAGVPCLGLYTDEYCRVKIQGALAHADLANNCISVTTALQGQLAERALALWDRREPLREHLLALRPNWQVQEQRRWPLVCAALGMPVPSDSGLQKSESLSGFSPGTLVWRLIRELEFRRLAWAEERTQWLRRATVAEYHAQSMVAEHARLRGMFAEAERYGKSLEEELAKAQGMFAEAERYAQSLEAEHAKLRGMFAETECYAKSLEAEHAMLGVMRAEGERYARSLEQALRICKSA